MTDLFKHFFETLKHFDALSNKAENYNILIKLISDFSNNSHNLLENERILLAYILSERAFSQGYEMGYSKAYENSALVQYFFDIAFKIIQTILNPDDVRYINYQKMAKA